MSDTPQGLWLTMVRRADPTDPANAMQAAGARAARASFPAGDRIPILPLRVGLAVARAVECVAPGVQARVKWPNDVLVEGGKAAGVLCEHARGAVLIGIGVNVNHDADELPPRASPPATSLRVAGGRSVSRGLLLERLADALGLVWARPAGEIPARELAALNEKSALAGRRVSVSGVVGGPGDARFRRPWAVDGLEAVGGAVLADGSLELLTAKNQPAGGGPAYSPSPRTRLHLLAGSVHLSPMTG